ncbi:MAG: DUF4145 domain-containing protein [Anaerolineales bacterium]
MIRLCPHCNNVTPHELIVDRVVSKLYDEVEINDGENQKVIENFLYMFLQCSTCLDCSLVGGFNIELPQDQSLFPVLYPDSDDLGPSLPEKIAKVYREAARIKRKAPNAYAGQIRKALEFLCRDQKAIGDNLYKQLNSLVEKGIIPPTLAEMTTLMRLLGNLGVHAIDDDEVSVWDAQLIDDFFRSIVEYVYIAPAKIAHLKTRLERKEREERNSDAG